MSSELIRQFVNSVPWLVKLFNFIHEHQGESFTVAIIIVISAIYIFWYNFFSFIKEIQNIFKKKKQEQKRKNK